MCFLDKENCEACRGAFLVLSCSAPHSKMSFSNDVLHVDTLDYFVKMIRYQLRQPVWLPEGQSKLRQRISKLAMGSTLRWRGRKTVKTDSTFVINLATKFLTSVHYSLSTKHVTTEVFRVQASQQYALHYFRYLRCAHVFNRRGLASKLVHD